MQHSRRFMIWSWLLRATAALVLFQTLFFKFTGAAESVYIFTTVGNWIGIGLMEPFGRIGSGVAELVACVLLLVPRTVTLGALLSIGVISGAIFFHLTALGIAIPAVNDRGELFGLALLVFFSSLAVLILHRHELVPLLRLSEPQHGSRPVHMS